MLCRRCNTPMTPGIAMGQTATGSPDFAGGSVVTMSPGGPGKIINCLKCPDCGHSVTEPAAMQQVIDERNDLLARTTRLYEFVNSPPYYALCEAEQRRLTGQHSAMCQYLSILDERIGAWVTPLSV